MEPASEEVTDAAKHFVEAEVNDTLFLWVLREHSGPALGSSAAMKRVRLPFALLATSAALLLTACSSSVAPTSPTPSQASASTSSGAAVSGAVIGAELPGHVHNLVFDGSTLLLGTHEGLWAQSPGRAPVQVSQRAFDVMGFTVTDVRWLASGHPGEDTNSPANLGLLESTDRGVTWEKVSLNGEVDFHRLAASGGRIFGISSADDTLLRSDDSGVTWTNLGSPGLFDIAIDPANSDILVGSTADGLLRSTDAGVTFSPLATPSLIALLAWTPNYVVGADVDGRILTSTNGGSAWKGLTTLPGQPAALGADASRIAVIAGNTVYESVDGGKTFTERITGIKGH